MLVKETKREWKIRIKKFKRKKLRKKEKETEKKEREKKKRNEKERRRTRELVKSCHWSLEDQALNY